MYLYKMAIVLFLTNVVWSSPVIAKDWSVQAKQDSHQDRVSVIFEGNSPNKLACDTTLRELPDGSWVMVMLGGGDKEPLPENQVFISRSRNQGRTWTPMKPVHLGVKGRALVPSELMVGQGVVTLVVSTHNGKFQEWKSWFSQSKNLCKSFGPLKPLPGVLKDRTFVRNHIVTKDGRILMPFQHYVETAKITNPRNGVIISNDGGKTWSVHGWIRTSKKDKFQLWAENNIVELEDGTISMLIRGEKGFLYRADSKDGGLTWPEYAKITNIPNPNSKMTMYSLGGNRVALLLNSSSKNRRPLSLWISFDGMKTWPYQRVLVKKTFDSTGGGKLAYPDGFIDKNREYLNFAYDDNRHRAVFYGAKLPAISNK